MKNLLRFLAFNLTVGSAYAQSNLPACSPPFYEIVPFHNCFGKTDYGFGGEYIGEWQHGKRNGLVTWTAPGGIRYVGEFKDDKRHGQGTYTFANGKKYVGEFKDGYFNGQGTFYTSNGSVINQGIWADDKFVRSAPVQQASAINQTIATATPQPNFSQSNLPACQGSEQSRWTNCFGTQTLRTGKFTGEFFDGLRNGVGAYTYDNGDKFVGEYKNHLRNGRGVEYKSDGTVITSGNWADGKLISFALGTSQFPFNWPIQIGSTNQASATERDSIAAEVEAERKKRQELEQQLAVSKERDQITAELDLERKKRQELEAQLAATVKPNQPQTNAPRRIAHALVIGNGAYPGSGRLDNPVNDANAISQKLRSMGFTVTTVTDANRQRLVQSMTQFRRTAASADISLLYYAGHGVQIFGTNYILPTDVDQTDPAQATIQGVSLNSVVENFLPGKTKLVFLDACRDNALQRTNDRSVSKGLAPISAAEGTLISYATKDGQTAADGAGLKNSPFTQALLEHLNDPQDIAVVLRKVRERVMKITGGKQQPWEYGSLTGGELVLSAIKPK
jgi:hypothetical protein